MKFPKIYKRFSKRTLLFAAALLLALSYLFSYYFFTKPSIKAERNNLQQYIHHQQQDFELLLKDSVLMRRLVQQKESFDEFKSLDNKPYGIFLFAETLGNTPQFLFWNDHKLLPPDADFTLKDGEYADWEKNGYYVIEKRTVRLQGISSNVIAYALIPVMSKYSVKTYYLYDQFTYDSDAHNKIEIYTGVNEYPIQSYRGKTLFYISKKKDITAARSTVAVVLQIAAFILLLAYIHFAAETVISKKGKLAGLAFLIIVLLSIRAILYFVPSAFVFLQAHLFSPDLFYANSINRSLGDLLINAFFFCWVAVFAWYTVGINKQLPHYLQGKQLLIAGIASSFLLVWLTFKIAEIVSSLVARSSISFNVNDFFSLNYYTAVGFVVLALLSLGYYYFTRLLCRLIFAAFQRRIYAYFLMTLAGLLYLSFQPHNNNVLFHLPVLCWLLAYSFFLSRERLVFNRFRINIAGVLIWIIVFSASLAAIILKENRQKEWEERKLYAKTLKENTAASVENVLNISVRYINNRFLVNNFQRLSNPVLYRKIRDSIINSKLSQGFSESYNVQFYLSDSLQKSLVADDKASFLELNEIYIDRTKPTGSPDIFLHEKPNGEFTYLVKRTIADTSGLLGNLFIAATPKKFKGKGFSFELLGQIDRKNIRNSKNYSHAIYKDSSLVESNNLFISFSTQLQPVNIPSEGFARKVGRDYDTLWYNAGPDEMKSDSTMGPDRIILVVKKQDTLIESISLFSYLFCSFLVMIALIKIVSIVLKSGNNWRVLRSFWQFNIRSQIQGTVIFVSVLSFIIIGVVTINFFVERYNRTNREDLLRYSEILINEMEQNLPIQPDSLSYVTEVDSASVYQVQSLIDRFAGLYDVDVNVYDVDGNLQVTSAPQVYNYGVLSTKMHPRAYYNLHRLKQVQIVQEENMSSLHFLSNYNAIRDEKGITRSYLNIPFYASEIELEQEISNFLIAIINLNAFIFLIAGTIAVFITNKITRSFSVIGDKMKAITLGRTNEEIEWNRDDEIGELVKQYNRMVQQLEQSAQALAKSEREGAWREMARQVAHEIKNPLTPMKLSIQYLQKSITNGSSNVKELTTSVASTLIEQIDHLSKIAADFGRFANIGNRNLELFDLHSVIESLIDLYSSNPNVQLRWLKIPDEVIVEADKTHMNRLFTNLLTNAIDACSNQPLCRISIIEEMKEDAVLIQIKDDGEGIPIDMQPKIFTPNFTTKTSGTGLGLAICKSIIEQAGGEIWFETEQGVGTTFFVLLPLAEEAL